MKNFDSLYQEARQEAAAYAYSTAGENVMIYPCGFAWVNIKPANGAFAKWLLQKGHARKDSYLGGVTIWVGEFNQSMDHKSAFAYKLASILSENGIKAVADERMD